MRIRVTSQLVKLEPGQEAIIEVPDAETAVRHMILQTVERNNMSTVEVLTVVAVEDFEWLDDAV